MLSPRFRKNKIVLNPAIADLFEPYERIYLDCVSGENPGPQARVRSGKSIYLFNCNYDREMPNGESIYENLLHEVAHGIEIPLSRFGYLHWGFNIGFPVRGKRVWAFERELMVAAIQKRLHSFLNEVFSNDDVFRSLLNLGVLKKAWTDMQGITELGDSERNERFDNFVLKSLEIIDRRLPATDTLVREWHRKCQYLDRFPNKIRTFRHMYDRNVAAADPLDPAIRTDLRSHGILS